jgi:hypothetical protein
MNRRGLKIDRKIKWIFKKWNVRVWTGFARLRIVSTVEFL